MPSVGTVAMTGIGVVATTLLLAGPVLMHSGDAQARPTTPATVIAAGPTPAPQPWTVTVAPTTPAQAPSTAPAAPSAVPTAASTAPATPAAPKATRTAAPSGEKVAYLTFDDGPNPPYTQQILEILDAYGAKATFFMIGQEAARFPDVVRQVRDAGHAIGNHSYTHPWLSKLPEDRVRTEITRTNSVLRGRITCLRPPGGMAGGAVTKVAREQGMGIVEWTVDTNDWKRPGTRTVVEAALAQPSGGRGAPREILLHDGGGDRSQTIAALPTILTELADAGYTFEALPSCR